MKRTTLYLTIGITIALIFGTLSASGQDYNTITETPTTWNLDSTNGNKVVTDPSNNIHMVYSADGFVSYVSSTDSGATWSAPVTLGTGTLPTVASDDFGNIGVAYSSSGGIAYVYKTSGGWSSPFLISPSYPGILPSITGFGNKMYITWTGYEVYFTSFATVSPVVATNPEHVTLHTICSNTDYNYPSIAAVNSGGPEPIIRVAYYSHQASCSNPSVGVYVVQRPAGGALNWTGSTTGRYSESYTPLNPSAFSVSLASNRVSGEFYLIYCFRSTGTVQTGGTYKVGFAHGDTTTNTWNKVDYFGGDLSAHVTVDVTAVANYNGGGPATGLFKTVYSNITSGGAPVVLKNGTWTGTTPTFQMGIPKSYGGRTPHVVDATSYNPVTGENKGINVVYEYSTSASHELRTDYFNWLIFE